MTAERKVTAIQREAQVIELAKAGYTFREIADHLGYAGPSSAHHAFKRAMQKTIQPAADEYRKLQISQYTHLIKSNWRCAIVGDTDATSIVLRAMDGIAKLMGLNAPSKVNVLMIVEQAVAELGLTDDERLSLQADIQEFIADQKVATP